MTTPSYVPHSFLRPEYRRFFGKTPGVVWTKPGDSPDDRRLEAARLQHAYACVISSRARGRFGSIKSYAGSVGQDPARLQRVLRGDVPMRFDDIGAAVVVLGGDLHEMAQHVLTARVVRV